MKYGARRTDIYESDNKVSDEDIIKYIKMQWSISNIARYLGVPRVRIKRIITKLLKEKNVNLRKFL